MLGESLYELSLEKRHQLLRRTGTAFQQDALFGSMSVADNVALPLHELTRLPAAVIDEMVELRLGLVGLAGLEERPPRASRAVSASAPRWPAPRSSIPT